MLSAIASLTPRTQTSRASRNAAELGHVAATRHQPNAKYVGGRRITKNDHIIPAVQLHELTETPSLARPAMKERHCRNSGAVRVERERRSRRSTEARNRTTRARDGFVTRWRPGKRSTSMKTSSSPRSTSRRGRAMPPGRPKQSRNDWDQAHACRSREEHAPSVTVRTGRASALAYDEAPATQALCRLDLSGLEHPCLARDHPRERPCRAGPSSPCR
jgi:hypothetical protein